MRYLQHNESTSSSDNVAQAPRLELFAFRYCGSYPLSHFDLDKMLVILPMDVDLISVIVALANLTDSELIALIKATKSVPQVAPGLLAWLDAVLGWELNRRHGRNHTPQPPAFATMPVKATGNTHTIASLRTLFGPRAHRIHSLLDALSELLTGGKRKN